MRLLGFLLAASLLFAGCLGSLSPPASRVELDKEGGGKEVSQQKSIGALEQRDCIDHWGSFRVPVEQVQALLPPGLIAAEDENGFGTLTMVQLLCNSLWAMGRDGRAWQLVPKDHEPSLFALVRSPDQREETAMYHVVSLVSVEVVYSAYRALGYPLPVPLDEHRKSGSGAGGGLLQPSAFWMEWGKTRGENGSVEVRGFGSSTLAQDAPFEARIVTPCAGGGWGWYTWSRVQGGPSYGPAIATVIASMRAWGTPLITTGRWWVQEDGNIEEGHPMGPAVYRFEPLVDSSGAARGCAHVADAQASKGGVGTREGGDLAPLPTQRSFLWGGDARSEPREGEEVLVLMKAPQ